MFSFPDARVKEEFNAAVKMQNSISCLKFTSRSIFQNCFRPKPKNINYKNATNLKEFQMH